VIPVDSHGDTLDFMLSEHHDEDAATAFFKQAINNNGFPDKVVMDKSGANYAGLTNFPFLRGRFYSNGWRIMNNPTIERSMININSSFFHNFFEVAIDEDAATAFFKQAINNNGFPDKVVMDKSGANYAGLTNINRNHSAHFFDFHHGSVF
jgi:transposase-like protein